MEKKTFEKYGLDRGQKLQIELLEEILAQLEEINENQKRVLETQPRPG